MQLKILLIINNIVLVSTGDIPREHAIRPAGVIISRVVLDRY